MSLQMTGAMVVRGDATFGKARTFVAPTRSQLARWSLAGGAGTTAGVASHRSRHSGDRQGGAAFGAVSGAAATDAALGTTGWAARETIQHKLRDPKYKRTKATRKILSAHKAKYGVTDGPGKNPPNAYYRNYPHELPLGRAQSLMGWKNNKYVVGGALAAGAGAGALVSSRRQVRKVDTTMSERRARQLARQYDTKGPLPGGLSREQKMKAYEARYIASGGRKAEKWKRRADTSETVRNIGLAGATTAAGLLLAHRGKRTGPVMNRVRGMRHLTDHRLEQGGLAAGLTGGASELYGEHSRAKRASYTNSAAGVAASALTRMRGYTPDRSS